jgi:hypothetical protein
MVTPDSIIRPWANIIITMSSTIASTRPSTPIFQMTPETLIGRTGFIFITSAPKFLRLLAIIAFLVVRMTAEERYKHVALFGAKVLI